MRRISRPFKGWLVALAIIALILLPLTTPDAHARLTATQSLLVEYNPAADDWTALGTLVIDLALGPRDHITYLQDRGWQGLYRWQGHDISVTRYFADERSLTFGMRRKVPEGGPNLDTWYGLGGWRWGG